MILMIVYCLPAAQDEFEVSTSVTIRLEEMRKTGGDKWLSLLNTDRTKQHTATTPDTVSRCVAVIPLR